VRQGRLIGLVALVTAATLTGCAGSATPGDGRVPTPTTSQTRTTAPPPSSSTAPTRTPTRTPTSTPTATPIPTRTSSPTGIPSRLLGREISVIPTSRHVVALTFDAGANDAGVASIVSTLRRTGTPATFFLTGTWVTSYPAQARTVGQQFRVGDHSVTHPHFTQLSAARIRAEVLDAAATIRAGCGQNPAPLFRFPFGDRDARTIAAVNALGYIPIGWTVDTLGWQGTSEGRSVASVVARVLGNAQPGEIVLMHVGSHPTDRSTLDADALPQVIARLHALGYTFVTLDALLTP
jgi:peptidoglycan/xylan/chitin deacetylase (PgdA/CDA1 family)